MRYASICSGIEAATCAWHPLGWHPVFFAENERFASSVLAHHYGSNMPDETITSNGIPNLGDITNYEEWPDYELDGFIGGTPCQDGSIGYAAGKGEAGAGLHGERTGLAWVFQQIVERYQPTWFIWENVPNLLTGKHAGELFRFYRKLAEIGYHLAWTVLDMAGFGLHDQPRKRLFLVGHSGSKNAAAKIFFEQQGTQGNSAEKPQTAPVLTRRGGMAYDDRTPCILESIGPRIATPEEWERAMGFPTAYTQVPYRNRFADECPIGPRYQAIGNSMSVDLIRALGQRIEMVEEKRA